MSSSIALVATRDFAHHGAAIASGDRLSVTPIEAAALTYQRNARFETPEDRHLAAPASTSSTRTRSAAKAKEPNEPKTAKSRSRTPRKRRRDIQPAITK